MKDIWTIFVYSRCAQPFAIRGYMSELAEVAEEPSAYSVHEFRDIAKQDVIALAEHCVEHGMPFNCSINL